MYRCSVVEPEYQSAVGVGTGVFVGASVGDGKTTMVAVGTGVKAATGVSVGTSVGTGVLVETDRIGWRRYRSRRRRPLERGSRIAWRSSASCRRWNRSAKLRCSGQRWTWKRSGGYGWGRACRHGIVCRNPETGDKTLEYKATSSTCLLHGAQGAVVFGTSTPI